MIKDVLITPLKIIETPGGNVMHAIKENDCGYNSFGEAYFSEIQNNTVKAWKRHKEMTLNIIVPVGKIRFVLFDDRNDHDKKLQQIIISRDNYIRLTVPPMIWFGFQGLFNNISMLLNVSNIKHNPEEVDKKDIKEIDFNWSN